MYSYQTTPKAIACIRGGEMNPEIKGTLKLFPHCNGVLVVVQVQGLPETATNFFALHIHEGDNCGGADFSNSKGHYNPQELPHPRHAGDLPPLLACNGKAYLAVITDRFEIQDVIGRTIIIHNAPDDFVTQPAGNAGSKIACGVIRRA